MLLVFFVDELELELFTVLDPFKLNVSEKKSPTPPKNPLTLSAAFDAKLLIPSVTLLAIFDIPSVTFPKTSFTLPPKSPIFDGKSPIHSNIFWINSTIFWRIFNTGSNTNISTSIAGTKIAFNTSPIVVISGAKIVNIWANISICIINGSRIISKIGVSISSNITIKLIITSRIGCKAVIRESTIAKIGGSNCMKVSMSLPSNARNSSLWNKAIANIAIRAPIPKVAALIPTPANIPDVPTAFNPIDAIFNNGPTFPTTDNTGPIVATNPVKVTMIFLVPESIVFHFSIQSFKVGTTLSLTLIISSWITGNSVLAKPTPKLETACLVRSSASVNSPAWAACSFVTIPSSRASFFKSFIVDASCVNTGMISAATRSLNKSLATPKRIASSSTPLNASLIRLKASSVFLPSKSSRDNPISAKLSAYLSPLPVAISPKIPLTFTNALSILSVDTPKIVAVWFHSCNASADNPIFSAVSPISSAA